MTEDAARIADQLGCQLRELERLREARARVAAQISTLCLDVKITTQRGIRIDVPLDRLERSVRAGLIPLLDQAIAEQAESARASLDTLNGAIVAAVTTQAPAGEAAR